MMEFSKIKTLKAYEYIYIALASIGIIGTIIFFLNSNHSLSQSYLLPIVSYLLLIVFGFLVYRIILRTSSKKERRASFLIAILLTLLTIGAFTIFDFLKDWEEETIYTRFSALRDRRVIAEGTGMSVYSRVPKARKDIQIIGITNSTREKMGAVWPIPWDYYADIINVFDESRDNVIMFDIFLLDYKLKEIPPLQQAIKESPNKVLFDYPMEVTLATKKDIKNLDVRSKVLREKYKLKNVSDVYNVGEIWLNYPIPPIEQISQPAHGLGFANIRKPDNEKSRKMPLVVKLVDQGENQETEYYPSIVLVTVCNYYGVDVINDTEIRMGEYVKIKNIPSKKVTEFNTESLQLEEKDIMTIPNKEREITIPIDNFGQMDINYVGGQHSFRVHHLHEVAKEWTTDDALNNRLDNKIFLVAMYYATGVDTAKDQHGSPFGEISGIEHHANALNTILNQDFMSNTSKFSNLLIYLSIGLLIGFLLPRLKTWLGFVMILLFISGYIGFSSYVFKSLNLITPLPSVVMQQLLIFVSIIGYRIFAEEENVKYIRTTFSKFVSEDVVDELLKDPTKISLGGSKREITIFFSDIRGFTTMSEALSPEELVQFLNEYLSEMTEIVIQYKGTIDKYMGDAIMAFWGAPIELEDHAYYACIAALAQLEALVKMQEEWKKQNRPIIDIGIGLNTGKAVVGNMGSSHRMEYTCMGDTINLGSRLEGSNKMYGTNIIISEYTYEKVKDRVFARELDLVRVKGKNQPVRIYELMGLKNARDMEEMKRPLSSLKK
ncbi:MAG: adenylate/guanylate cyclase domain-containing protein [Spirochaetota bacterium]